MAGVMARPGLLRNRKFVRMERMPGMTKAIALGSLELIWSAAYESGEDVVGTAEDIELAADWRGEPGALFTALRDAGLPGRGFIEEVEGMPGMWRIHDLYDHAPEYVQRRMEREAQRIAKGKTISDIRSAAAKARWDKENHAKECKRPTLADPPDAKVLAPAPAPAPAPALHSIAEAPAGAPLTLDPVEPQRAKRERDPRFAPLKAAWLEEFAASHGGAEYHWSVADSVGIHRVISCSVEEFRDRARRAFAANGYLNCGSCARLTSNELWNKLAGTGPPGPRPVTAAASDRTKFGKGEVTL